MLNLLKKMWTIFESFTFTFICNRGEVSGPDFAGVTFIETAEEIQDEISPLFSQV